MDQKPEGTPNPLNPSPEVAPLDANPSEPVVSPAEPVTPAESVPPAEPAAPAGPTPAAPARPKPPMRPMQTAGPRRPRPTMSEIRPVRPAPTAAPMQPVQPMQPQPVSPQPGQPVQDAGIPQEMGVVTNMDGTTAAPEVNDPMNRPMEKAATPEPPKPKKKTGLIIGIIVSLFVAVGCGVAAILLFVNADNKNPVAVAASRIITGDAPENAMVDGEITIDVKDLTSPITDMRIDLNGEGVTKSMINSTVATLSANLRNGGSFTIGIDEVYAATGDLYLRVSGINNILEDPYIFGDEPIGDEESVSLMNMLKSLAIIDDEWIRLPVDEVGTLAPDNSEEKNVLSCTARLLDESSSNSNTIAKIYEKNPFITSTDEDIAVESAQNPIYKVKIDEEVFKGFAKDAQDSTPINNLVSCMGYENIITSRDDILGDLLALPEFYVEVDENNNFTRLYFGFEVDESGSELTADLRFTYPENVNVPEPIEYKDFSTVMDEITQNMYEGQETEGGTIEGEEAVEGEPEVTE